MPSPRSDQFLSAATELLDREGAAAISLREIAGMVGVSHNAPYKHFASKQDLLAMLIARELHRICDAAEAAETQPTARTMMQALIIWAMAYPQRFWLMALHWHESDNAGFAEAAARWQGLQLSAVKMGQDQGTLPAGDRERLSDLIRSTAIGAIHHYVSTGCKEEIRPQDMIDDLFRHLARRRA